MLVSIRKFFSRTDGGLPGIPVENLVLALYHREC